MTHFHAPLHRWLAAGLWSCRQHFHALSNMFPDVFHVELQASLLCNFPHTQVLSCWSVELQTAFLNFATGTSRLPAPGSELLKVECPFVAISIAESKQHLGMLPQVCCAGYMVCRHSKDQAAPRDEPAGVMCRPEVVHAAGGGSLCVLRGA
eukprot:1155735-Pelagomonas_calceolata.AAC.15